MKKAWSIRRNEEAVSPVIATILMVAITVVLAAVLYVMVLGFGGGGTTTPTATYSRTIDDNVVKVTIVGVAESDIPWGGVTVQMSLGTTFWEWTPATADLEGGSAVTSPVMTYTAGGMEVTCTVTDKAGNGFVSGTDFMTIECALGWTVGTYNVVLLYEDTGEAMGNGVDFTMS